MFYLQYTGPYSGVNAAVFGMTSSTGFTLDTQLLNTVQLAALSAAVAANVYGTANPGSGYTGNVQLLIRGGYEHGATTFSIKLNDVALTNTNLVRTGDPGMRLSPS